MRGVGPVDAIVILGCKVLPTGEPGATLARRARAGARAFHDGLAPIIIASGGRRWNGHAEASAIASELRAAEVHEAAIVRELCSLSTVDNALYVARLLPSLQARRVAVVTCHWHLDRALHAFRAAGIAATGLAVESPPTPPLRKLYLFAHEKLCVTNDKRRMKRHRGAAPRLWIGDGA